MAEFAENFGPVLPPSLPDPSDLPAHLASRGRAVLRSRGWAELVDRLGRAGERFLDPTDPIRREAVAALPDDAGVSAEMAEVVVRGMARDWTRERLEILVRADFPDPGVLDAPGGGAGGDRWMAIGDPFALHVASGSVPGVGATSLLRSLLVKTPVLLKPGRGDRVLAAMVGRAIREEDPDLAEAFGVVYWRGGDGGALEDSAFAAAARIVVYGGAAAVRAVTERVGVAVPVVAYRHRVSVGLVGRGALARRAESLAADAARAVALFDQRGCVSPHMIWVEEGGAISPRDWAGAVAEASERVGASLPPGPLEPEEAARVQQFRAAFELRTALSGRSGRTEPPNRGERLHAGGRLSWTVVLDPDPAFTPSCLGRTLQIKPVSSLEEVPPILASHRGILQSVALEVDGGRREELVPALAAAGATRITTLARQPWPPAWWRHDGMGALQALVRWVSVEE